MFWQCKYAASSRIDEILDQRSPATTQEVKDNTDAVGDAGNSKLIESEIEIFLELLEEDDILQEVRAKHDTLIEFLCTDYIFHHMISMIINEPPESKSISNRFKHPSVVSEILSSSTDAICSVLVTEPVLEKLWTLLDRETNINPLQASFFAKIVNSLFPSHVEPLCNFMMPRDNLLSSLVNHIGNSAFADVIMRIVTYQENEEVRDSIMKYVKQHDLVGMLVKSLGNASDNQAKMNSAMILEDFIRLSRDLLITSITADQQDLSDVTEKQCAFLYDILCDDTITTLLDQVDKKPEDITTVGFTVKLLVSMITAKPMALSLAGANEEFSENSLFILSQTTKLAFDKLKPVVSKVCAIFRNPPPQEPVNLTNASAQKPFGWVRLEIIEFVNAILEQFAVSNSQYFLKNSPEIVLEIVKSDVISEIIDAFFEFSMNNILHGVVVKCIRSYMALCTNVVESDESIKSLLPIDFPAYLFKETRVITKLIESWSEEASRLAKQESGGVIQSSQGNFGHAVLITNAINKFMGDTNTELKTYLGEDDQLLSSWQDNVLPKLETVNNDYDKPLGGSHPNKYSTDDDDSTNVILSFNEEPALQKAFQEYESQEMTMDTGMFESLTGPRDTDEFFSGKPLAVKSFNQPSVNIQVSEADQERNLAVFESLCNQKLNAFGGLDDDGDNMETTGDSFGGNEFSPFDANFNAVFGTSTANMPNAFNTSAGSDPFSSGSDPFSNSGPRPSDPFTSPAKIEADPFPTEKTGNPDNWADFSAFGSGNPAATIDSLVLDSIDDEEPPKELRVESDPFSDQPMEEEDSQLAANFGFLTSTGLVKDDSSNSEKPFSEKTPSETSQTPKSPPSDS